MQSERGGRGRFNPIGRNGTSGGGHGGGNGGRGNSAASSANVQHPGHIPGSLASRPLSGVFAIDKPSGVSCMDLLDKLKDLLAFSPLFRNPDGSLPEGHGGKAWRPKNRKQIKGKAGPPKVGQGGTLDPLASGVLVIGLGTGTKQLQGFLDCAKTYESIGLLGASTTSYDSQDPILRRTAHSHVTSEMITSYLPYFTGPLLQYPPLFSAVRMDGKRLFEYARQNLPLPRPIEAREIEILDISLLQWLEAGKHEWRYPVKEVPEEDKKLIGRVKQMAGQTEDETETVMAAGGADHQKRQQQQQREAQEASSQEAKAGSDVDQNVPPAAFKLRMTVSSGTYVRSIVHDVGLACSSSAHVVELRRTRQGEWVTEDEAARMVGEQKVSPAESAKAGTEPSEITAGADAPQGIKLVSIEGLLECEEAKVDEPQTDSATPAADTRALGAKGTGQDIQPDRPSSQVVLPWSLFEEAIAEQAKDADPNARCRGCTSQDAVETPQLKEWEKRLLEIVRPC